MISPNVLMTTLFSTVKHFFLFSQTGITRDNTLWDQTHTDTRWLTFIVIYMIKYLCVVYSAKAFCSLTHSDFSFHSSKRTEFTDYISFYFSYSNQSVISSSGSCYTKCATTNVSYETDLIRMSHVKKKNCSKSMPRIYSMQNRTAYV